MRKLLLQLDTSPHPSVFDRVVACDAGADVVMSYGGVAEGAVRDMVHGAIFTRGPKDLHHTAIFIGGTEMAAGERLLGAAVKAMFGPMRVSVMLDSNGSNTTASAAVARLLGACGDVSGRRAVVVAGTGPVGLRAAGLLARAGAEVVITSRRPAPAGLIESLTTRFGGTVRATTMADASGASVALDGAALVLNAGPAGVEGIEVTDNGTTRDGVVVFGALGVGGLKMKIHKACIARLFERNDQVFDAEAIFDVARELAPPTS